MANNKVLYAKFFVSFPISFAPKKIWLTCSVGVGERFTSWLDKKNQIDIDATKSNIDTSSSFTRLESNKWKTLIARQQQEKMQTKKELPETFVCFRESLFILYFFGIHKGTLALGFFHSFSSINRARSNILWNILQYRCLPEPRLNYSTNQLTTQNYFYRPYI